MRANRRDGEDDANDEDDWDEDGAVGNEMCLAHARLETCIGSRMAPSDACGGLWLVACGGGGGGGGGGDGQVA
jgi:hypothetical protein